MPVTEEQLEEILRAAMAAPSAGTSPGIYSYHSRSILKEIKVPSLANMLNKLYYGVVCGTHLVV